MFHSNTERNQFNHSSEFAVGMLPQIDVDVAAAVNQARVSTRVNSAAFG